MRKLDLEMMDLDELWLSYEELTKVLAEETLELEKRLTQLNRPEQSRDPGSPKLQPAEHRNFSSRGEAHPYCVRASVQVKLNVSLFDCSGEP